MRGPRTSAAVLSREGRGRGQSLPQTGPGFKDAGNAKRARHPTPARGQAYPDPIPQAPASEGRSSHPSAPLAPGTPRKEPRKSRDLAGQKDQTKDNELLLLERLLGPDFPGLSAFSTFHRTRRTPRRARCPQPPAVLSLGTLIAPPGSTIWLIYRRSSRRQPRQTRACLVRTPPCFLYPCTFCPAK